MINRVSFFICKITIADSRRICLKTRKGYKSLFCLSFLSYFSLVTFAFFLPFFLSHMVGAYLFYAQHTFPGVVFKSNNEWTYADAALESSSYLKMNPILNWVTANIGYHHIHHLNSRIPFYRLPETMASIEELQHATTTTFKFSDIYSCLRLKLWDSEKNRMIALSELNS